MAKNIFILGAGASVEAGVPVMNNFLEVSRDLLDRNIFQKHENVIRKLFEIKNTELQRIYAKAYLDLNNIETLFGVIEMGKLINGIGKLDSTTIAELKRSLVIMIAKTIEETNWFKYNNKFKSLRPSSSYQNLLTYIKENMEPNECTFMTFNYDVNLEVALNHSRLEYDYCIERNSIGMFTKVLKLHGSINWYQDLKGKLHTIYMSLNDNPLINLIHDEFIGKDNIDTIQLRFSKYAKRILGNEIKEEPVIIPPTWNKTEYNNDIAIIWETAAKELSEAENIYIIGYSLPESDQFFRYLFALGTLGIKTIRRIWIINPDDKLANKYRSLLGRETDCERYFKYFTRKFDSDINEIFKNPNAPPQVYFINK